MTKITLKPTSTEIERMMRAEQQRQDAEAIRGILYGSVQTAASTPQRSRVQIKTLDEYDDSELVMEMLRRGYAVSLLPAEDLAKEVSK